MQPGIEAIGVAQCPKVAPRPDERLLDRVAGQVGIAQDEEGGCVQPGETDIDERGEGVMIASPRSLDESSLIHGRLTDPGRRDPSGRARQGMAPASRDSFSPTARPGRVDPPSGGVAASVTIHQRTCVTRPWIGADLVRSRARSSRNGHPGWPCAARRQSPQRTRGHEPPSAISVKQVLGDVRIAGGSVHPSDRYGMSVHRPHPDRADVRGCPACSSRNGHPGGPALSRSGRSGWRG